MSALHAYNQHVITAVHTEYAEYYIEASFKRKNRIYTEIQFQIELQAIAANFAHALATEQTYVDKVANDFDAWHYFASVDSLDLDHPLVVSSH